MCGALLLEFKATERDTIRVEAVLAVGGAHFCQILGPTSGAVRHGY
jgi:hypothetical protein